MHSNLRDVIPDPRVSSQNAHVNGRNYREFSEKEMEREVNEFLTIPTYQLDYILGVPGNHSFKATMFLIHGWPDLSIGWRNQVPLLLDLGLRVVCPDIMGYGGTNAEKGKDAPRVPLDDMYMYGFKRAADDIKELARQLGAPKIILGGHDWGGAIVYRVALWHPDLVTHLFSICTPYIAPSKEYLSIEELVKTKLPNFTYQLQLASPELENAIQSRDQMRQFLNAMYGGRGPNKEVGFDVFRGVFLDNLPILKQTRLLNERELDYYADEYARHGLHGTLNWYRNREQNFNDEKGLEKATIDVPILFIQAIRDSALPPTMAVNMGKHLSKLTRRQVNADHWALWEAPEQVNSFIKEWLETAVFGTKSSL
ncbi:MAG: hypothetical protein M1827_007489 [Pycnora praestabilis]|nr:MAG: hypothetical protein M1827_007489 [Pycnora praestabilis]